MQIEVGDVYPGLCCAGYNWEVALIFPGSVPAYNSIWGTCQNLACTGRDGNGTDPYQGVSSWLQEDFEERLAQIPYAATKVKGGTRLCQSPLGIAAKEAVHDESKI